MKYGLFWSALCLSFGIFLYGSLPLYEGIAAAAVFFVLPALAAIKIPWVSVLSASELPA